MKPTQIPQAKREGTATGPNLEAKSVLGSQVVKVFRALALTVGRPFGTTRLDPHLIAVLLLPLIVLWRQDNTLFTEPGMIDPWMYFGFFKNLAEFKAHLFPSLYYGSRLPWILPGALVHSLFSPLVAAYVLHLTVHLTATISLFAIVKRTVGSRAAFLTAMVFCVNPWLWSATGWDYVDGAGVAYCLMCLALLTRAAQNPMARGSLLLAGAASACAVYTNLYWVALAPLLPLYYLGLVWAWRSASPVRASASYCLWAGAGFSLLTIALCSFNYALDGHFWFYEPSITIAKKIAAEKNPYFTEFWIGGRLGSWLWFSAIAAVAALGLLMARMRRGVSGLRSASSISSAILLLAVGIMWYTQSRGTPVLGLPYYASYLFPFVFPVIGVSFWSSAEKLSAPVYALTCCAGAVAFGQFLWTWSGNSRTTVLIGGAALVCGFVLRQFRVGTPLALAGFFIFTMAVRPTERADPHTNRKDYLRLLRVRESVERARKAHPVRFWYNVQDPDAYDYIALGASYTANYSWLGLAQQFPQHGCDVPVPAGTLVVVSSRDATAPEVARKALTDCWHTARIRPVIEKLDTYLRSDKPYTVAMLRAETDYSLARPLRAVFDGTGKVKLQLVDNPTGPVPLPLNNWTGDVAGNGSTSLRFAPGGLVLRTPAARFAAAARYGPLFAPETGRYSFKLKYRPGSGGFAFGARPMDDSHYLAAATIATRAGDVSELEFSLNLEQGEPILLRIVNNNPAGDGAASFLMEEVTATELKGAEAPLPRADADEGTVLNGAFENDLTGWSSMEGTIRVASECYRGKCVEFQPRGKEMQYLVSWNSLSLQKGKSYELSAWIRSGTGKPLRLECGTWDVSRQQWVGRQTFTATPEWSAVKVRFLNDTNARLSPIFWQSLGDLGSMFVDEVEVKQLPSEAKPVNSGGLIPNGGFEAGLSGWDGSKGKIREGSNCHSGECVEFLPLGKEMQYLISWNSVKLAQGKTYELSAWIRSGTGKLLRLDYGLWDSRGQKWAAHESATAKPEWTKIAVRFPSGTNERLSPIFWESLGDFGSLFVDDVELKEITAAASPAAAGKK